MTTQQKTQVEIKDYWYQPGIPVKWISPSKVLIFKQDKLNE